MRFIRKAALFILLPLVLSGCFKSDQQLIGVLDATAPVSPGIYSYTQDGVRKTVLISVDWPATVRASVMPDGSSKVERFYMRKLFNNYYIVMDAQNNYGLVWVENGSVAVAEANECEKLQDIEDEFELEFNHVEVVSDTVCKFKSFDALADAYKRLIEEKAIKVAIVYEKQ